MLGSQTSILQQLVNAATNWRNTALTQNVALFQLNATFPDGRAVVLFWNPEAIDNADGAGHATGDHSGCTFTGDWQVDT